jgi:hypothetical protein
VLKSGRPFDPAYPPVRPMLQPLAT